jgi:hypothetical protein
VRFSNALSVVLAVAMLAVVVGEHIDLLNGKPADDVILLIDPDLFPSLGSTTAKHMRSCAGGGFYAREG